MGNLLGLTLDMRMLKKELLSGSFELKTNILSKMDNLMLLQLNYVKVQGSYENFSKELRWLCMHGFPSKYIPSDLPTDNLVALDMSYSNIESFINFYSNPQLENREKVTYFHLLFIHAELMNFATILTYPHFSSQLDLVQKTKSFLDH